MVVIFLNMRRERVGMSLDRNILKTDIGNSGVGRSPPDLETQGNVGSADYLDVFVNDAGDAGGFVTGPYFKSPAPVAPDDAVGDTHVVQGCVLAKHVRATGNDAIVKRADEALGYADVAGGADVDAIGVVAPLSNDLDVVDADVAAAVADVGGPERGVAENDAVDGQVIAGDGGDVAGVVEVFARDAEGESSGKDFAAGLCRIGLLPAKERSGIENPATDDADIVGVTHKNGSMDDSTFGDMNSLAGSRENESGMMDSGSEVDDVR